MKTPLTWLNLRHHFLRTFVAIAGVAFAVLLIFMQLGFLNTVAETATLSYSALNFDVCIRSRNYLHFVDPNTFPRQRLYQALGHAEVTDAAPFYVSVETWSRPQAEEPDYRQRRGILLMGVRRGDRVFRPAAIQQAVNERLLTWRDVLVDTNTRRAFGPKNDRNFSSADWGTTVEISGQRLTIRGTYELGTGLSANGAVLMNADGFDQVVRRQTLEDVNLGLVTLGDSSPQNRAAVARQLQQRLPPDVEVLSREEMFRQERYRWVWQTSFGLIFQLGVVVALFVGVAIVYQVLVSDVASLLPEYATLKAIGYSNRFLAGIVVKQALILAVAGFVPGLGLSLLLYRITSFFADIPIRLTAFNFLFVLALTLSMCLCSGMGAVRKVFRADPADLF